MEHPGSRCPPEAGLCWRGWWASRVGSERQDSTRGAPCALAEGKAGSEQLPWKLSWSQGSSQSGMARAGRQPARHPRRLPWLSLPTSFAPSSGDEPPWSFEKDAEGHRVPQAPCLCVMPPPKRMPSPAPAPSQVLCSHHPTENSWLEAPAPLWLQDTTTALQPQLLRRQQQMRTLAFGYQQCFTDRQLPVRVLPGEVRKGWLVSPSLLRRGRATGTEAGRPLHFSLSPRGVLATGVTPQPPVFSHTQSKGSLKGLLTTARAAPPPRAASSPLWLVWDFLFYLFFFLLLTFMSILSTLKPENLCSHNNLCVA